MTATVCSGWLSKKVAKDTRLVGGTVHLGRQLHDGLGRDATGFQHAADHFGFRRPDTLFGMERRLHRGNKDLPGLSGFEQGSRDEWPGIAPTPQDEYIIHGRRRFAHIEKSRHWRQEDGTGLVQAEQDEQERQSRRARRDQRL